MMKIINDRNIIDNRISEIFTNEEKRQKENLNFIASENFSSEAVMNLTGSIFTNKYAEGYSGKRFYNGCANMDDIEDLAIEQLKLLYNCNYANVQPHSGANANTAVFQALLNTGDKILGMDLASGGHLSHGAMVNISGKIYDSYSYSVNEDGLLDYENIMEKANNIKPQLIIAGASAYPRQIDWKKFRDIADSVNAYLLVDMAHYSGLIAGFVYDNPIYYADVVTSTTHKTLRGPRGGIILWNNPDFSKKINSAVFPGTQGGPLMNVVAAKAQAFIEAYDDSFSLYSQKVVRNARAMCSVFNNRNLKVLTGGTDSHIILLDVTNTGYSGKEVADILERNGIIVNKNGIPNDTKGFIETSGIRLGTAAETTRLHDEQWFSSVANNICDMLQ